MSGVPQLGSRSCAGRGAAEKVPGGGDHLRSAHLEEISGLLC